MLVRLCTLLVLCSLAACGNPVPDSTAGAAAPSSPVPMAAPAGEMVEPPFAVRDGATGLLLAWFDASGIHAATDLSQVPEGSRQRVRVDSLSLPPEQRLDPAFVYVADLRKADERGNYPVRKFSRQAFDAFVDAAAPPPPAGDVVLYKASWCGACKAAEAYLTQRGVDFAAHDIEKDGAAAKEMQRKVSEAGKTARGVPVIDFRGEILLGFDKGRLATLIDG